MQEKARTYECGGPSWTVARMPYFAKRNAGFAEDARKVTERGENAPTRTVRRCEDGRRFPRPGAASHRVHLRFLPANPVVGSRIQRPGRQRGEHDGASPEPAPARRDHEQKGPAGEC